MLTLGGIFFSSYFAAGGTMSCESSIYIALEDQQTRQIFFKKIVAIPHVLENESHEIHSM